MRDTVLDAAQELVQDRGLNGVSFQDIADKVGLKKPSLFHHFRSKDELALALMERCRNSYGERYAEVLSKDELSEPDRLKQIARLFDEGLRTRHLCLLGALSNASGAFSEELKAELSETANGSIERYSALFEAGKKSGTLEFKGAAEEAASAFLAMLQGLQLLARAKADSELLYPAALSYIDSISGTK